MSYSITVTTTGGIFGDGGLLNFTGGSGWSFHNDNGGTGSSNAPTTGSIVTVSGDVVAAAVRTGGAYGVVTAGTGFTLGNNDSGGSTLQADEYQIASGLSSSPTFSFTNAEGWACCGISFSHSGGTASFSQAAHSNGTTSFTITPSSTPSSGDLLVLFVSQNSSTVPTIADTNNYTWQLAFQTGADIYGNVLFGFYTLSFATVVVPTVTTQAESSIAGTTATANGNITNLGNDSSCSLRGFVYDTVSHGDPGNTAPGSSAYAHNISASGTFTPGAFTGSMSSLSLGTVYYVRSFAKNGAGYGYGSEVSFTTENYPTVTTQAETALSGTTATANGNITSLGGDSSCSVEGFVYDTSSHSLPGNVAPGSSGYAHNISSSGTFVTGPFTGSMTGLTATTTYFVRAFAENSIGYSYGAEISFSTSVAPSGSPNAIICVDG